MAPGEAAEDRRIGILGGTFDPPHLGHLLIAETARAALGLEAVLFLPAGEPWLKSGRRITGTPHRQRMVELAIDGNADFRVCDRELRRNGPSYTVDTLRELRAGLADGVDLYFIVGSDVLTQFHRWKEPERILELCRLVVVERPDGPPEPMELMARQYPEAVADGAVLSVPGPRVNFSASELRRLLSRGASVRYQVPDTVADYIKRHGLYRNAEWPDGDG
jgi:nicotinate-nucleotide adenylyltransferase